MTWGGQLVSSCYVENRMPLPLVAAFFCSGMAGSFGVCALYLARRGNRAVASLPIHTHPHVTTQTPPHQQAILANLAVALVNYLSTFLALYLVDRAGRRLLLICGGVGMGVFTGLFALFTSKAFNYEARVIDLDWLLGIGENDVCDTAPLD